MTVRELIKQLLDEDLDNEVKVLVQPKHCTAGRYVLDGLTSKPPPAMTVLLLD